MGTILNTTKNCTYMKFFRKYTQKSFFILFLATSMGLMSCSGNDEFKTQGHTELAVAPDAAYQQLTSDLAGYNEKFVSRQTRLGGWWRRFFIGLTDAVGAIVGTVYFGPVGGGALGAGASALLAQQTGNATTVPGGKMFFDKDITYIPAVDSRPTLLDSVGFVHNKILIELEAEDTTFYSKVLPSSVIMDKILEDVNANGTVVDSNLSGEMAAKLDLMKLPADCIEDQNAALSYYKKVFPEYSNQLDVLKNYTKTVEQLPDSVIPQYTDGYLKVVDSAPIPLKDKEQIKGGVLVGGNSTLLWKPKEVVKLEP